MGGFVVRLLGLIVTGLVLTGSVVFFGASLRSDVAALSHEVQTLRGELLEVRGDMRDNRTSMVTIQRDVDGLRAEAKQSDMGLQASIQALKFEIDTYDGPSKQNGRTVNGTNK